MARRYKIEKYNNIAIITDNGKILTKYQIVKLLNQYYEENKQYRRRKWKKTDTK